MKTEVMLYVKDVEKSKEFWEKIGYQVIEKRPTPENYKIYVMGENKNFSFNIIDEEMVKKYSPEVLINFPSILLRVEDLEEMHSKLKREKINVTEIQEFNGQKTFSVQDPEEHYIAIMN